MAVTNTLTYDRTATIMAKKMFVGWVLEMGTDILYAILCVHFRNFH